MYLFYSIFKKKKLRDIFNNTIKRSDIDQSLVHQIILDITTYLTEKQQTKLWNDIEYLIKTEQLHIEPENKDLYILKAMATYSTSHRYYGPIVSDWAESVLDTAVVEGRKLIFLARDGIAPYKAAQLLKAKNPEKYGQVSLSLLHLSRTLAYTSTQMDEEISSSEIVIKEYVQTLKDRDPLILLKYIQQEADIKPHDKCLIIDVGFAGSMIPPIKRQLRNLEIDAQFVYLISHTTQEKVKQEKYRAHGFLAHREDRPLGPVDKAGGNPAVHWIEDTHQGIIKRPHILIQNEDQKIVPATVTKTDGSYEIQELFGITPQTCRGNPEEFLVKSYGLKGVLAAVSPQENSQEPPKAWKTASESKREFFGNYLEELRTQKRALLIRHQ